ncbi:putative tRNA/rRNA methyltransferase YsgA, partial [Dissostichus eleginoides]
MSLPVNSDYLSLERIARYRHACSNGSPFAQTSQSTSNLVAGEDIAKLQLRKTDRQRDSSGEA